MEGLIKLKVRTFNIFVLISQGVIFRSSGPEVFLRQGVLKFSSKFRGEHLCRRMTSIKLQSNVFEITLRHGCSPVNFLYILRTPFPRNTSGQLLLYHPLHGRVYVRYSHNCYKKVARPKLTNICDVLRDLVPKVTKLLII